MRSFRSAIPLSASAALLAAWGAEARNERRLSPIVEPHLSRMSAAVEGEYAENDRRLNWFLLVQAFLFQAYATALQAITGATTKVPAVDHSRALLAILIAVGIVTALLSVAATLAGARWAPPLIVVAWAAVLVHAIYSKSL